MTSVLKHSSPHLPHLTPFLSDTESYLERRHFTSSLYILSVSPAKLRKQATALYFFCHEQYTERGEEENEQATYQIHRSICWLKRWI